MKQLHEFPSIEQFRHVVKYVKAHARYSGKNESGEPIYDPAKPIPALDFIGTVKLHGTNAAVCQSNGERWLQSRGQIIEDGHYGFAEWAKTNSRLFDSAFDSISGYDTVCIYGEWCGQGIQKGVGISSLDKMFVVFAVLLINGEDKEWMSNDQVKSLGLVSVYDFPTFEMSIDFNAPELSQNSLVALTEDVEKECPVAKHLGSVGIGEGIVWSCVSEGWNTSAMWFKVKGEKHSETKVKTLAEVDIEKVNSIRECVDKIITENRMIHGLSHLSDLKLDLDIKNMSAFLKWLASDAIKEEADIIIASGLEPKDVGKAISMKGRDWFIKKLNEEVLK